MYNPPGSEGNRATEGKDAKGFAKREMGQRGQNSQVFSIRNIRTVDVCVT